MNVPLTLQTVTVAGTTIDLFVPEGDAVKKAFQQGRIASPYWSQVWPSAKALATFLVQNQHYINGKKVVELGAGLGLPSLVAARFAASVVCSDHMPAAVDAARLSAARVGLQNFTAQVIDWQQLPAELEADVVLLSDVNYDPHSFPQLQQLINRFIAQKTVLLISTPQRLMAKAFIAPLLSFCTRHEEVAITHEGQTVLTTVMVIGKEQVGSVW